METYFYFVITPDARVYRVEIKSGRIPELEELQNAVEGYIETVRSRSDTLSCTPYRVIGIVNEDGHLKLLAENPIGSMVLRYPELLVGNVVIAQVDGEDIVGFNELESNEISRRIYHIRNLYAVYFDNGGTA